MIDIATSEEVSEALERSMDEPIVFYKHSTRCSLSGRAQRKIEDLTRPEDPQVYRITVQTARDISNDVAERLGIRHETPQVIIVENERPIFTTSHHRVSAEAVRAALQNHSSPDEQ